MPIDYRVEVASIHRNGYGWTVYELGFVLPKFHFIDKENWQFFQQGHITTTDNKAKLSVYLRAMISMRDHLNDWIEIVKKSIEKYGDLEPE